MTQDILFATLMIGGIGLVVGIFLGIASKVFYVKVDEKEAEVLEALPGANCGACGYSGCSGLAAAIAKGHAFVRCVGDCESTTENYDYSGTKSCLMAKFAPTGGPKSCRFGCTGFGDCVAACEFDAIHIERGIAVVDKEKCVDCKACIKACPKGLIVELPYKAKAHVACVNPEKGKPVMSNCKLGCITCQKCAKECPKECIDMSTGYPVIDYEVCINCGKCVRSCPRKCIVF